MKDALGEQPPLERVVEAVATIAKTLSSLHGEGISHRDIKPANLYEYDESVAIGDFGLVSHPDTAELTGDGKQLGPLGFLPEEMLTHPSTANGMAVDVFELAKTLHVLVTGQRYPPQGSLRVDEPSHSLAQATTHPRVPPLDRLLERATIRNPAARPSMSEFAQELFAWLRPAPSMEGSTDLSRFRDLADSYIAPHIRANESRQRQIETLSNILVTVRPVLDRLGEQARELGLQIEVGNRHEWLILTPDQLDHSDTYQSDLWSVLHTLTCSSFSNPTLITGIGGRLRPDEKVVVVAGYFLFPRYGAAPPEWRVEKIVENGSALLENTLRDFEGMLEAHFPEAIEQLFAKLQNAE